MRRVTKKIFVFLFGLLVTTLYCEFFIYYVVIAQCDWPTLHNTNNPDILKAFILADTHLLGPFKGHWLDKWRREWQMKQAFQAIILLHKPDVVFVLGDLFDEGEWTNDKQFDEYVERFNQLFSLPDSIKMYVAVGNHDIGFHNGIRRGSAERFEKKLRAPSVQHITLKNNIFVLINSMALEGDNCHLCRAARSSIENVSENLRCSEDLNDCVKDENFNYSRQPILMQHFPLYRVSHAKCTEPDAQPLSEKNKRFKVKLDVLSKTATDFLISKLKPRVAFGGHTHHGCVMQHSNKDLNGMTFLEYSVPSFSWRNQPDPKYMLVTITPSNYAVNKCGLPMEFTIFLSAVIMISILLGYIVRMRSIGKITQ